MKKQIIHQIVDENLQKLIDLEINALPINIAPEMLSDKKSMDEDWKFWLPINSQVTNTEIEEWEERIGYKLPEDYKTFLRYKHFYELVISEASFFTHPINTWRARYSEVVFAQYSKEFLLDKGYIPFASWSDWGYLCFDTNVNSADNNYPIVLWDHEDVESFEQKYTDFYTMLLELNEEEKSKNKY